MYPEDVRRLGFPKFSGAIGGESLGCWILVPVREDGEGSGIDTEDPEWQNLNSQGLNLLIIGHK